MNQIFFVFMVSLSIDFEYEKSLWSKIISKIKQKKGTKSSQVNTWVIPIFFVSSSGDENFFLKNPRVVKRNRNWNWIIFYGNPIKIYAINGVNIGKKFIWLVFTTNNKKQILFTVVCGWMGIPRSWRLPITIYSMNHVITLPL